MPFKTPEKQISKSRKCFPKIDPYVPGKEKTKKSLEPLGDFAFRTLKKILYSGGYFCLIRGWKNYGRENAIIELHENQSKNAAFAIFAIWFLQQARNHDQWH